MARMRLLLVSICIGFWGGYAEDLKGSETDYQRAIAPILAEHCAHCHGVDEGTRQGGIRFDLREGALANGDSGSPAIVPGSPDASELVRRITSSDSGEIMPPPSENKPLSPEQVAALTQWIADGATYEKHWAFQPPTQAPLPESKRSESNRSESTLPNPIDAFVDATLQKKGIEPSPKADDETLIRRLYLDIIGLPPSPSELDKAKEIGYEKTVDALLASDRYGEKWGRTWLDLARYSDTNGYEKDLRREQWKYREWVIDALNQDMPFDRFVIEQIAGDMLPNATQSQIIATGLLRNSMINEEGAIIPEQFRMVELFDRVDCVGKAILGLTTQCAQCHSHKFDPISHEEYFGIFAFLNNSYEAQSWVYSDEQLAKIQEINGRLKTLSQEIQTARPNWERELENWVAENTRNRPLWRPLPFHQLESVSGLNHPTQEEDHSVLMLGHTSGDVFYVSKPEPGRLTGVRLELLTHNDLPHRGPGRSATGGWGIHEIELHTREAPDQPWGKLNLVNATADFSNEEKKGSDEKKKTGPVSFLIDGTDDTTWVGDRGTGRRNQPSVAVVQLENPIEIASGGELKFVMRMSSMVGCCRVSITGDDKPSALPIDYADQMIMHLPPIARSESQREQLFRSWGKSNAELKEFADKEKGIWREFPVAETSILHMMERPPVESRSTHLLDRGEWDQPKQPVKAQLPKEFHPLPEGAPMNRLGFAMWLVDRRSPFAARVVVNRMWQSLFGEGLLEMPDDFGTRTPVPIHRELLDWLAVDFMEKGWSQKTLLRTIVLSDTYQRSSVATEAMREFDPKNVYLARGPRFRSDAEVVRDIALSVSGLIHHKLGGPSVIPPVPQSVLDYNYTYPSYWKAAEGPDRYRRGVYGFRKRSMPDPVASAFDAPNADFSCAKRVRSNTPLAALTGLNETIFVEAARGLALRVLRESGEEDTERIEHAYRLCVSRKPTEKETAVLLKLLASQRQRISEGWLNPREITTGDSGTLPELPKNSTPQDAAAWTIVSRVLLNLDETITKN